MFVMTDTFKTLWDFCGKRQGKLKKAFIFNFLRTFVSVTQFIAIVLTIDTVIRHVNVQKSLITVIILTLICVIGTFITSYFEQSNSGDASFLMIADKRVGVGSFLRNLPLGFFTSSSTTKITASLTSTLSSMESAALFTIVGIVSGLVNTVCLIIVMFFYNTPVAFITLVGTITYVIVLSLQIKVSRKNAPSLVKTQNDLSDKALTYIKGIKVTKAFSFKEGDKDINDITDKSCKENINLTNKSMPTQFLSSITVAVFESIIIAYVFYRFLVLHNIYVVDFMVLIIFSFFAFGALNQAGSMLSMIGLLDSGLKEITDIEKNKQMETLEPLMTCQNNVIEFKNVSFKYDDKSENNILDNINLKIEPHTLTAIIGPSGSGKTTLCHLIPRFYDVTKGCVLIGGADVKNIKSDVLMKKISMVFQNVYLFEDTILNNIRFGKPEATMEEVIEVSKKACCHDFISKLPDGYNTVLKEGGTGLSGGEKQRISIARAMLKDSPIVILDEATSALDVENEKEILSAIDSLIKDKTVIMIAHRINTVKKADKIVALENGKIVQCGNHEQLINEEGLYKDFVERRKKASGWKIEN